MIDDDKLSGARAPAPLLPSLACPTLSNRWAVHSHRYDDQNYDDDDDDDDDDDGDDDDDIDDDDDNDDDNYDGDDNENEIRCQYPPSSPRPPSQ